MHYARDESMELNSLFRDIKSLKMNVAYPFLLNVYSDYKERIINKEEFNEKLEEPEGQYKAYTITRDRFTLKILKIIEGIGLLLDYRNTLLIY